MFGYFLVKLILRDHKVYNLLQLSINWNLVIVYLEYQCTSQVITKHHSGVPDASCVIWLDTLFLFPMVQVSTDTERIEAEGRYFGLKFPRELKGHKTACSDIYFQRRLQKRLICFLMVDIAPWNASCFSPVEMVWRDICMEIERLH